MRRDIITNELFYAFESGVSMGLFSGVAKALGLDPNDRAIARYEEKALIIDSFEPQVKDLSDEELAQSASFLKHVLKMEKRLTICF